MPSIHYRHGRAKDERQHLQPVVSIGPACSAATVAKYNTMHACVGSSQQSMLQRDVIKYTRTVKAEHPAHGDGGD